MARHSKAEESDDGSSSRVRRRQTESGDAKLKRNLARARAIAAGSSSSPSTSNVARAGRRRSGGRSTRDGGASRLRFLLAVLLVTTLSLVVLQTVRHFSPKRRASTTYRQVLSRLERLSFGRTLSSVVVSTNSDAHVGATTAAFQSTSSGAAIAAERRKRKDDEQNPLDWRNYIAAMRKHFHEELSGRDADDANTLDKASSSSSSSGMVVVPGEGVRDHVSTGTLITNEDEPNHVPGKTKEEARQDRAIAMDELDQETLKAMFDAVYGRRI